MEEQIYQKSNVFVDTYINDRLEIRRATKVICVFTHIHMISIVYVRKHKLLDIKNVCLHKYFFKSAKKVFVMKQLVRHALTHTLLTWRNNELLRCDTYTIYGKKF